MEGGGGRGRKASSTTGAFPSRCSYCISHGRRRPPSLCLFLHTHTHVNTRVDTYRFISAASLSCLSPSSTRMRTMATATVHGRERENKQRIHTHTQGNTLSFPLSPNGQQHTTTYSPPPRLNFSPPPHPARKHWRTRSSVFSSATLLTSLGRTGDDGQDSAASARFLLAAVTWLRSPLRLMFVSLRGRRSGATSLVPIAEPPLALLHTSHTRTQRHARLLITAYSARSMFLGSHAERGLPLSASPQRISRWTG